MHQHEVDLPHAEITAPIIGAFYDVYRELGYGFSELVYRRALAIALRQHGLEVAEEQMISVTFRGFTIGLRCGSDRRWSNPGGGQEFKHNREVRRGADPQLSEGSRRRSGL